MYLLPSSNVVYLHLPYSTFEAGLVNLGLNLQPGSCGL